MHGVDMIVFIFPNLSKKNCRRYTEEACELLHESGCGIVMQKEYDGVFDRKDISFCDREDCVRQCDVIVVIGGDGTILKIAEDAALNRKPILGINCGRLGFMASLEYDQLPMLKKLSSGGYAVSSRMMLNVCAVGEEERSFHALNDIVLSKAENCKIADFKLAKDGVPVSFLRADGVIFSTPTGSTAYSMSAGGPIIDPGMDCIEYTQMCAHSLFARTMIFSGESELYASFRCQGDTYANVSVDGNIIMKIENNTTLRITRSELRVDIIDLCGSSFFNSVNDKLMQPLKGLSGDDLQ